MKKKKGVRRTKADWTLSDYKEDAWNACSKYVRKLYSDFDGYASCVTCGITKQWQDLQAGHFTPGRRGLNFFDLRNIHVQCYGCNCMKKGNLIKYWPFMVKKYGQEVVDELLANDEVEKKYTKDELIAIKQYFVDKFNELE